MYVVGLDVDSRAYFTSATCAISLLYLMNTLVFFQIFSIRKNIILNINLKKSVENNKLNSLYNRDLIIYNKDIPSNWNLVKGIKNKEFRNKLIISSYQRSILIGILLSDGWMSIHKGWNPSIGLKQSIKNFEYLWFVFIQLSSICSNTPFLCKNIKRGKLFYSLQFNTRRLICLKEIYNIFYEESSRKKKININLFEYMDYVVIAHWIMGDGSKRNKGGIVLCTDSFSISEVTTLINILLIKFNIKSVIHMDNNRPRIYINKKELLKFRSKIVPYFVPHFNYKIF